ncbi:MAG: glycosyltransferase family 2 protein [Deltaproteobacteria bacterium]|jgi:hypothetical protein|nr:glycosyltransferase family 2 protein [Deltaproteobacteria bacterium]
MQYCAACLIAKDEEYYLQEWVEYHLRIGFDTLIIYDNGSKAPIKQVLQKFIILDRIIVHEVPGTFTQAKFYTRCIEQYRTKFKWIAFIDSDEFIFPKKTSNIKIFLAEYEDYGGVVANWVNFGTSGLMQRKNNSQIFNFILTDGAESSTVKSIVQPSKVEIYGIHGATFLNNHYAVSSDHVPLHQNCYSSPFINDKIQINHYAFRTWEDYERKLTRKTSSNTMRNAVSFEDEQKIYTKPSIEILKFYAQIKNIDIKNYSDEYNIVSVKDFTTTILSMLESPNNLSKSQIMDAELLCCYASLIFDEEPMIYYFRAVFSRVTNDLQKALRFIYIALKLSGSSIIYYEYANILCAIGEHEKERLAKKQADYKKYVEDTKCVPIIKSQ